MAHIPYGYIIENCEAKIDDERGEQVRILFCEYIKCGSITQSANTASIRKTHSAIGLMLSNKRYLGDDFYPAIIETDTFNKAAEVRKQKLIALGRTKPRKSMVLKSSITIF